MPELEVLIMPAIITGAVVLFGFAVIAMFKRFYRKVDQGRALIVNKMSGEPLVTFTGGLVWPVIYRAEEMDISVKTIEIDRRSSEGLICKDNIRADIKVTFFVRVNKTSDDVLQVAQSIGCERASDQRTLEELFTAKFSEALKTVGKKLDFVELYAERDKFRDDIIDIIGKDLNGYRLEDAAIDYLEQTPIEHLDKDNILDAEGIRKITQLTTEQNVLTNDFKQTERKAITKQNVEAEEAILELKRQEAEAIAKQKREVETDIARQESETKKAQAAAHQAAEQARILAEREIAKEEENKLREVEVAQWNRQRVVAVEAERANKEKDLEAISRERETELQRIAKEKAIEIEKKEIADVVRGRIAVDKTVAEEEERIKDLREVMEANRKKNVVTIAAEAAAQEHLVKEIKAAEAAEEVAKKQASIKLVEAQASLEASDKEAQAKIRLADGDKATVAAAGLAEVQVKEANAMAIEKEGLAKARVTLEQMQAEAAGAEKKGLAEVKVKEADAAAVEKQGLAEANARREKMLAEAVGTKEQLLAVAAGDEAKAAAYEKQGLAEAAAVREKALAEAAGLTEKAAAMKALDGVGREHEEFRLELDKQKEVELAGISARKDIALSQAEVLGAAFKTAKINIVGGDGRFFDQFMKAVSLGQSTDGFVDNSQTVQTVLSEYLSGEQSLPADVKEVLTRPALSAQDLKDLSLAGVLGKLMAGADDNGKRKLAALLDKARELGIDQLGAD